MKKTNLKKIVFGATSVIVIGSLISGVTYSSKIEKKDSKIFFNEESKLSTKTAKLDLNNSAQLQAEGPVTTPTVPAPMPPKTKSIEDFVKDYESAVTTFIESPSEQNFNVFENAKDVLDKTRVGDKNTRTEEQKKSYNDFNAVFTQYKNFAFNFNFYKTNLNSKLLLLIEATATNVTKAATLPAESKASDFEKNLMLKKADLISKSAKLINSFQNYIFDLSSKNKTDFETLLTEFEKLPEATKANSEEMKLLDLIKLGQTFANSIFALNLKMSDFSSTEAFSGIEFQKELEEALKTFATFSTNKSVSENPLGKLFSVQLEISIKTIQAKFEINKALVQYAFSVNDDKKSKYDEMLTTWKTTLKNLIKKQATLKSIPESENSKFESTIDDNLFSANDSAYVKTVQQIAATNALYIQYSAKPSDELKKQIEISSQKVELFRNWAITIGQEINKIKNPAATVAKPFSQFVEEFNKKNPSEAAFGRNTLVEYGVVLNNIKENYTLLNKADAPVVADTQVANTLNWDIELKNQRKFAFNNLNLDYNKLLVSVDKLVVWKNSIYPLKIDTLSHLNVYLNAQKAAFDKISEAGENVSHNGDKIKSINFIIDFNTKLLIENSAKIQSLKAIENKTADQQQQLKDAEAKEIQINKTINDSKVELEKLNQSQTLEIQKLDVAIAALDEIKTDALIASNKKLQDKATETLVQLKDFISGADNLDDDLTIENLKLIDQFKKLKSYYIAYYKSPYIWASGEFDFSKELDTTFQLLKQRLTTTFAKSSLDIISPIFTKFSREWNIYRAFLAAVTNPIDYRIATSLNNYISRNTANVNYQNLASAFFNFWVVKDDLNLDSNSKNYQEAKDKFETLVKASNEILLNPDSKLSVALIIIKNVITDTIVKVTNAKIQIIEALNNFLNNRDYFEPYLKEATTRNKDLLNPSLDVLKLDLANTYLTNFKNLVSAIGLVTNAANNALGDQLVKAIQKSIVDPESFSLNDSVNLGVKLLASGSTNPWTTQIINRMLKILNSLDSNRTVNILIKNLNSVFDNEPSVTSGFAADSAYFLKMARQQIINVKNAKLNTFSKAINEIGPEIGKLLNENLGVYFGLLRKHPDPSKMSQDEMRMFNTVEFRLKNVLPLFNKQQSLNQNKKNIPEIIKRAKAVLSNFQKVIIATLSDDDKARYTSALEKSAEYEKTLKDVVSKRQKNDQDFAILQQKLKNYLTQKELESVKMLNAADNSASELIGSQSDYDAALKSLNDFVSSGLVQALNSQQLAKLNELKTQRTTLQNEVSESQKKLTTNKEQITKMFAAVINKAFTPSEAIEYNKVASELLKLKSIISTKKTNVLRLSELVETLKLVPTNNLTNEQKENLIVFQFELNREQNDLKPFDVELTKLNAKISEFNTKISTKLPAEQKKTYDSLIFENAKITKDLETKPNSLDEITKQIKNLEQIVINLLIKQEANSIQYTGLWQTLSNAQVKLIEAKAKFELNSETKRQILLLLHIAFTPEEFKKYSDFQDITNTLIADMNEALRNVTENRKALAELDKIINDKISKLTNEGQKDSLESNQKIIAEQDTYSEQLNNLILSLQIKINEEFIKSYTQLSKNVLHNIKESLEKLKAKLKTTTDEATIKEINEDIKITEEQIKMETENLELLEGYLPKIVALDPIVKSITDQYDLDITAINSSINNITSQSLLGTQFNLKDSATNALNTYIESLNKGSNSFKWTTDQLKKYSTLINVFQSKNSSDKAFEQFKSQPNLENQKAFNDAQAALLKSITDFEKLSFKPTSLQPILDRIKAFKNDYETKEKFKTNTKNYFSNPTFANRFLWAESLTSLAAKLKDATDKLNEANALPTTDKDKNEKVEKATYHLNIIKQIDEESKQYLKLQNTLSTILDLNSKFDTLDANQINNGISQAEKQLNSFTQESSNYAVFEASSWILQSLQNIRNRLANRQLNSQVNVLGKAYVDKTNLLTFSEFSDAFNQALKQNLATNDFSNLKSQIKLIEDAIDTYKKSTYANIDTINIAIKKVYDTKNTLVTYLMANQNMPKLQSDFIIKTNTMFDQILDSLNNVLNTWKDASKLLNNSLTIYANNPTPFTLRLLFSSASDAQVSRVSLPVVDKIIIFSTQAFNLENQANQISVNPILRSSIAEFTTNVEKLKKLISDEPEFKVASGSIKQIVDSLNSRVNILEINAQIFSGGADYRELNKEINIQIRNLEQQPQTSLESLDKIQTKINNLQPANPQQTNAKQALSKKLLKAQNEVKARDAINALRVLPTPNQVQAILAFTNDSLNIYTPIINILNQASIGHNEYVKLMSNKDDKVFLSNVKTVSDTLLLDTINAETLKGLGLQSAKFLASLLEANLNRKLAYIQITSALLEGINKGDDQLINNSKQRFEQNQQLLTDDQKQDFTTLFNLLSNWHQTISLATNGNFANRNKINTISKEVSKLSQLPEVLKESIDNKTNQLGVTQTSHLAFIIIISVVFGLSALIVSLSLIIKKTRKKNKQIK